MTADFYDDDSFRDFWQNSEAMKNLQKTIRASMAPALEAISQSAGMTAARQEILDTITPTIDASTVEAMRAIAASMPAMELPSIPSLNFGNITQLKLGDSVARQVATSVDFDAIREHLAETKAQARPPAIVPDFDLSQVTEDELDEMVDAVFAEHPDLAVQLEDNLELTTLTPYQKKAMCWILGLMVAFGAVLLHAWGTVDEQVGDTIEVVGQAGGSGYAAYKFADKYLRRNDEKDPKQEPEDE